MSEVTYLVVSVHNEGPFYHTFGSTFGSASIYLSNFMTSLTEDNGTSVRLEWA